RADERTVVEDQDGKAGERRRRRRIGFAEGEAKRQRRAEDGAPALLAFDRDAAAHGRDEALRDREAEARAFEAARMGLIGLREFVEDMLAGMFVHADAGILDFEQQFDAAALAPVLARETERDATFHRELDRVAREVQQDLAD